MPNWGQPEAVNTVFDETSELVTESPPSPVAAHRPHKSHRMMIAVFFLGLNLVILLVWLSWPSQSAGGRGRSGGPDAAAPFTEPEKPRPIRKPSPPLVVDEDAPAEVQEESRQYKRAHLQLQLANRWKLTHPEKARKFAQEAIDLAPNTDIAAEAEAILKSLK